MCSTCGCAEGNLYIEGDEHRPHSAFRSAPFSPCPASCGSSDRHYLCAATL